MSEFNGKKFYGFSLQNDPALSTTTRNFEFKYTRPEQLERAIQKVQLTDNASEKQKKTNMLSKYCKVRRTPRDVSIAFKSRDVDIETHISRNDELSKASLTEHGVDKLIVTAKPNSCALNEPCAQEGPPYEGANWTFRRTKDRYQLWSDKSPVSSDDTIKEVFIMEDQDEEPRVWGYAALEEYQQPQAHWVEIVETAKGTSSAIDTCRSEAEDATELPDVVEVSTMPLESQHMPEETTVNVAINEAIDEALVGGGDAPTGFYDMYQGMGAEAFYDLEYEMMTRHNYTKYVGPKPKEEDMINASHDSGGFANFIEVETPVPNMHLSFLKNASPLRYSDMTDELSEQQQDDDNPQMKVYIKGLQQLEQKALAELKQAQKKSEKTSKRKSSKSKAANVEKESTTARSKTSKTSKSSEAPRQPSVRSPRSNRSPRHRPTAPTTANNHPSNPPTNNHPTSQHPPTQQMQQYTQPQTYQHPTIASGNAKQTAGRNSAKENAVSYQYNSMERGTKNLVISKSIEELKLEKIAIFTKMMTMQERIIETLDTLRINLLEIYVPNNSFEKTKRQKNAFEFSVRFSRNFLYPLKSMIEDLKATSVEQLNSASSNDASARVAAIYGLIYQSLQTYQKQLRYFLLDQVPQKLTTLIEMIFSTTNICLEKGIFDRYDAIIDCMQERCTKFLGFLEDMHEERFLMARENYRKMNIEKNHSNYNLKMYMNDLNMYEPKLVPKNVPHGRRRGAVQRKIPKKINVPTVFEDTSDLVLRKVGEDAISTQMEETQDKCSSGIIESMQSLLDCSNDANDEAVTACEENSPLNKAIMEALQVVTKEQVRQVLEPFMQSLGNVLEKKGLIANAIDIKGA